MKIHINKINYIEYNNMVILKNFLNIVFKLTFQNNYKYYF